MFLPGQFVCLSYNLIFLEIQLKHKNGYTNKLNEISITVRYILIIEV